MVIELLAKKKDYFELLINNNCNRRFKKTISANSMLAKGNLYSPTKECYP
jgi:hypothetical protein